MRLFMRVVPFVLVGGLTACATLMQGTKQGVAVSSSPTGARVMVDGQQFGMTPVVAELTRKDNHIVRIEMDGYQPFEQAMARSVSGWVWGNIVFGGLIGLAVDAISGGMYKLTPDQINATLAQQSASLMLDNGETIVLIVTLEPDASWTRIGQLEPAR